jgi:hypothetical protein
MEECEKVGRSARGPPKTGLQKAWHERATSKESGQSRPGERGGGQARVSYEAGLRAESRKERMAGGARGGEKGGVE